MASGGELTVWILAVIYFTEGRIFEEDLYEQGNSSIKELEGDRFSQTVAAKEYAYKITEST